MTKRAKKAKKSSVVAYDEMVKQNKATGGGFVMFTDTQGNVSAVSPKANPTREDFRQGFVKYPRHVPTHRDANGVWQYKVVPFTDEEIERNLASIRGSETE